MAAHPSRTCDVYELAHQGQLIEGELQVSELPRLAASVATPTGTLKYSITGRLDDRGRPGASLHLNGDLTLECQRCGVPLRFQLQREGAFRFVASEEELNALPLDDDEEAEAVVGGRNTDLVAWIEDEAILSLPLVPRHEDCQPTRVEPSAEREPPDRPNPFAVLAELKGGRKPH